MTKGLLLRRVEVDGAEVDVHIVGDTIARLVPPTQHLDAEVIVDGDGGALVPGLHDHHIHLLATAAALASIVVGPPDVTDSRQLAAALSVADHALPPGAWLRAVSYHESVAGDLDRVALDRFVPGRPVRVQHRSGGRWTLNSAAVAALGVDGLHHDGLERDGSGRVTGRIHRGDDWLRSLLPRRPAPDLAALGRLLAGRGVTGVTDATPYTDPADLRPLADAVATGAFPQRVLVTGAAPLAGVDVPPHFERGPVKIVVDDADYPSLDSLCEGIAAAHEHRRNVAIHCVTRTALVLALAAWDVVGSDPGDRVEHGSVVPTDLDAALVRHRLTVVTQPGFVAERGDDYLADVDPDDLPHLYRCRSLLEAGIAVAGSTDAPYSDLDPWRAIEAAVRRMTRAGKILGAHEGLDPRRALGLFTGDPHDPGRQARAVAVGARADLCLLAAPLDDVLTAPWDAEVVCVVRAGRIIHPPP